MRTSDVPHRLGSLFQDYFDGCFIVLANGKLETGSRNGFVSFLQRLHISVNAL
jgi:hypothetical protein